MSDELFEVSATSGARVVVGYAARSDVGRRRPHNEDSWAASFPLYFVADGMGGHHAGEIASQAAVDSMLEALPQGEFTTMGKLSSAITHTALRVAGLGQGEGAPGSTLTGIAFQDYRGRPCAAVFNIGDSRTYLLSEGVFEQVSIDHSEVQELLDAGQVDEVQARALPRQNVITRALGAGSGPDVNADIFMVPAHAGDRWVICSDGLSGEVTDALIEMVVRSVRDRQAVADELIAQALNAGGKDNVTVLVVDVVESEPTWDDRTAEEDTIDSDDTLDRKNRMNSNPGTEGAAPSSSDEEE